MSKSCLSALEYKLIVSIAVELLDEPDSGKGTAMLSEYVEMFLSFHGSGRGGMHLLGGAPLTFGIILMFRLSCAKFVFLCSKEVSKMVSERPPLCKRFFQPIAYNFSLLLFSFFLCFFFPLVFLGRRICLVCFLVNLWFQGGFPMSISCVVEQF